MFIKIMLQNNGLPDVALSPYSSTVVSLINSLTREHTALEKHSTSVYRNNLCMAAVLK
jgi:hypothetical protein